MRSHGLANFFQPSKIRAPIPDYSYRVDYRQKQLKAYINSTLKESLIKARKEDAAQAKKKGKSKSLQEQLGISDVSSLFKQKKQQVKTLRTF